jgi:hypothetical protein
MVMSNNVNMQTKDPFTEYRRQNSLPEKFVYGMNCLLDRWFEEEGGEEITQLAYEFIRKNPKAYSIVHDTSSFDLPGIPILFAANLNHALDAWNFASARIGLERKPLFINLYYFLKMIRVPILALLIPDLNKTTIRISTDNLINSESISFDKCVLYKARHKEYYDFIFFQGLLENGTVAFSRDGRRVPVSELKIDDLPEVIIIVTRNEKKKHFRAARELGKEEMNKIYMPYKYIKGKPAKASEVWPGRNSA